MTEETDDFARWGAQWKQATEALDLDRVMRELASRRRRAQVEAWLNGVGFALLVGLGALALVWFGSKNPASAFVLLFAGLAFGWSLASRRTVRVRMDAPPAAHVQELWLRERELSTRHARGRWLFWVALAFCVAWVPWTLWSHAAVYRDEPWLILRAALVMIGTLALFWYRGKRSSQKAAERLAELERLVPDLGREVGPR